MRKRDLNGVVSWLACLCLLLTVCLVGCDDAPAGPATFKVSGKVTFDGEPVPAGMVIFVKEKGNVRVACAIEDGYYETQDGKGHLGGKYSVQIDAKDGVKTDVSFNGTPMWSSGWATEVDLSEASEKKDFDIPKSEVRMLQPGDIADDPLDRT